METANQEPMQVASSTVFDSRTTHNDEPLQEVRAYLVCKGPGHENRLQVYGP